jgi:hypothetical protein
MSKEKTFKEKFIEEFQNILINILKNIFLYIICWSIGFYLLFKSSKIWSVNDEKSLTNQLAFIFLLSIFLILIPLVKSIKFLNIFELEREIKETKNEVKDFKTEIRQSVSLLTNSLTASIGNMNNNVTVHIPKMEQLKEANRKIDEFGNFKEQISFKDVKEQLSINSDEDIIMALARTRIKIETLLRELTGPNDKTKNSAPYGTSELFKSFSRKNPEFSFLKDSFRYVLRICNAAIHGMDLSYMQAEEAIELGIRIIKELEFAKSEKIENNNGYS